MAKSKSSSRTSTSKKNNLKLKWWYVLPVILVVAIAGYAIVRFSEASVPGLKTVDSGLNCEQGNIVDKTSGGVANRACNIAGGKTASATWQKKSFYDLKYTSFCAYVFFGPNASIIIRSQMKGTLIPDTWTSSKKVTKPTAGYFDVCSGPWDTNRFGTWDFSDSAKLEVTNNGGGISVVRMYLK